MILAHFPFYFSCVDQLVAKNDLECCCFRIICQVDYLLFIYSLYSMLIKSIPAETGRFSFHLANSCELIRLQVIVPALRVSS